MAAPATTPVLKNEVRIDLQKLMLAVIQAPEQEEEDRYESPEKEIEKDNWLMLSFGVAKELGYTLQATPRESLLEELMGWSCYFGIINRRQEAAMKKAAGGGDRLN